MLVGFLVEFLVSSSGSLVNNYKNPAKYICLTNQPFQARLKRASINSYETLFYPFSVSVNKYGGSCNTIDCLYTRVCVSNKVKNINAKLFNLKSGVNETIFLDPHKLCECSVILNKSVCNSKLKWNHDESWCEWGSCKNNFM